MNSTRSTCAFSTCFSARVASRTLTSRNGSAFQPRRAFAACERSRRAGSSSVTVPTSTPKLLGLTILAFVEVRVARHGSGSAAIFRDAMMREKMVVGCYMVTGGYDFLLKVVARDLDAYKAFTVDTLMSMQDVQDIRTSLVLDLIKNTAELPLPMARAFA